MLKRLFLILLVLVALMGCQTDNAAQGEASLRASTESAKPPVEDAINTASPKSVAGLQMVIIPSPPMVTVAQLNLDVSGCQANQLQDILWQLNGSMVGSGLTLEMGTIKLHRGDTITVDANCGKQRAQTTTVVVNSPPWIKNVELENTRVTAGEPLVLVPHVVDADGDPVRIISDWRVNGESLLEVETLHLPAVYVETGAEIEVRLTPDDGLEYGRIYVIGKFQVPNQPPHFDSSPSQEITAFPYIYDVRATDPDGDSVTYQLDQGPEGMLIDESSGQLRWTPLPGVYGEFTVKIRAVDSQQQADQQVFTITLPNLENL